VSRLKEECAPSRPRRQEDEWEIGASRSFGRRVYRVALDDVRTLGRFPVLTTFAGGRLFGVAHTSGAGQPWVLALPGWTRTYHDFDQVLDGLDAIAIDLPGFGVAPPPPEPWSTARYAEWVAPVLDELGAQPVLLGHSFGGRVALHLAASHPDRIGALVLTGVPRLADTGAGRRSQPALAFRVARVLHRAKLVGDDRMETLRQRYGSADYRAATGVMRGVLVKAVNETYEQQLAAFPGPIELVWGDDDDQAPIAAARAALEFCRDGTFTALPGAGHWVPRRAPQALREAALRHRPAGKRA
jgi:pimeloyl-ACP methyl ester carboxylesterase